MNFNKHGTEIIQQAISDAASQGKSEVVITGNYEIERAIVIPSDFTVILNDCHLRLKDGVYTNIFTNPSTLLKNRTVRDRDQGIHIIGRGRAILDGGTFNGLNERNCRELNMPMCVNSLILFTNLENFSLCNLQLRNQRYWSVNINYCSNGLIRDLDILADDSILYVDGERDYTVGYRDLCRKHLNLLRNADGIDLRKGCHDITIENITGFTEDDTIALTAVDHPTVLDVEGLESDIYNITVRNIKSSSWCAIIRLLNQGGVKLYNILIDGVFDTSKNSTHMNRGLFGIRIGDKHMYGSRHSTAEETYNIAVKNVFSRAVTLIDLAGSITNLTVENVFGFDGFTDKIVNHAELYGKIKIDE